MGGLGLGGARFLHGLVMASMLCILPPYQLYTNASSTYGDSEVPVCSEPHLMELERRRLGVDERPR